MDGAEHHGRTARTRRGRSALPAALALALALVMSGLGVETANAAPTRWAALTRDYIAFTHMQDPIRAGSRGDREALRRWPDNSDAARKRDAATLADFHQRLAAIPSSSLSPEDALSRAVMARQIDLARETLTRDESRIPFQNGEGFFTTPDTQAAVTTLASEDDAEAWLARMAAVPAYFATETANMQRGIDTGFTQPAIIVEHAIAVVGKDTTMAPEHSPLLLPFATLPASIPAETRAALKARGVALVKDQVQPAQARLATFLKARYLPKARPDLGAGILPDGAAEYAFAVRRETTTNLTPAEIHRLGEREIGRIRAEMQTAMAETGFKGDLKAFIAKLNTDPEFYAPTAEVYAEKAGEICKRIDYLLPRYFGLLPRLTYGVRAKPAGLESTSDGYLPGSLATGQSGIVVYSATAAPHSPLYSLPAWLLHEGVPGHHLQISLAQENAALPEYRRNDDITAYVEGWALYSEKLGEEMGVYRNGYERFGRLSMEMWRACRLVMDTGLHVMGWSRDQAAACMKENTAMSDEAIYDEVDRYIGWPGQALGYKIGELQIEAARRDAEQALGPRFDLRAFHDVVLGHGALPMDLLRQQVNAWVASQTEAKAR